MEKPKILIVEDDLIIAEQLKAMIEGDMGHEVVAIFTTGEKAIKNFKPGFADIVIMDITLADAINGIDTSIKLREISPVPIIYLTDNTNALLRKKAIFETDAVYYIPKPYLPAQIAAALELAIKKINGDISPSPNNNNVPNLSSEYIFVKESQAFKKILISDILYVEADRAYCELVYVGQSGKRETIVFSENLSALEEKLQFAKDLVRVNRSFVVNLSYLKKIKENALWIEDKEIRIGKTYRHVINERVRFI